MAEFTVVDVFTDTPLAGNQLAVFTDARGLPDAALQPLAREVNFSETVFVYPPNKGGDARIRIFTPAAELPFAGHPVLGTAVVVALDRGLDLVRLETGRGVVPVAIERGDAAGNGGGGVVFGRMQQPLPTVASYPDPAPLLAALGVGASRLPVEVYDNGPTHLYVALAGEADVAALAPDLGALARVVAAAGTPLVGVSCFAGSGTRWTTRMFAPVEQFEDPATGSAAGPLAVHLARHGLIPFGAEIEIAQGAQIGRPSTLYARADGTSERLDAVAVGGAAVIVARGAYLPAAFDRFRTAR